MVIYKNIRQKYEGYKWRVTILSVFIRATILGYRFRAIGEHMIVNVRVFDVVNVGVVVDAVN